MYDKKCSVCKSPLLYNHMSPDSIYSVTCMKCGDYRITSNAGDDVSSYFDNAVKSANLSGWLKENQNRLINSEELERLSKLKTPTVHEKATKLLIAISKAIPIAGQEFTLNQSSFSRWMKMIGDDKTLPELDIHNAKQILPLVSASWSSSPKEFMYLISKYLHEHHQYIYDINPIKITPNGWSYLDEISRKTSEIPTAFIAMKFAEPLLKYVDKYFYPAIESAGYKPERANDYQHNNLIDDEIVSLIRTSRFIIADYTKNSAGVYYEAGFARGLKIPVICTCEKRFFDKPGVHFDQNHYSFLFWERTKGSAFQKNLQFRIESTLGKGNYQKS